MDSINGARKPHAVCVPYPTQGHVTPMLQLTKLLHTRGFHITFVNTEYNHRRLLRSRGPNAVKGLPDFRFETIPDGLPQSDRDASQDIPSLCDSTRKNCLPPFKDLLAKIGSSSEVPPVTCIISDGVMSFAIKAAKELGIPGFQLWTASACGFMGYLSYRELIRRGIVPFKDESYATDGTLDAPIDWIPGMPNMLLKDIPTFLRTTDLNDIMFDFLGEEAQNCLKATAVIINTFDELEHEVLEALKSKCPRLYTAGPLSLHARHLPESPFKHHSSSLWKEDHNCIEWLDKREPNSVVYVNYGSITTMTDQHLIEFAWGLANSRHPFLWILRSDVVNQDVNRHEIEALVKEVMEGEKGKEIKKNAMEWKRKAFEATDSNLNCCLISRILNQIHPNMGYRYLLRPKTHIPPICLKSICRFLCACLGFHLQSFTLPKMDPKVMGKPHAVCVPFPAQGHVNPMMQVAKLLHSRGFYITFVNTEFNHRRLLNSLSEVPPVTRIVSDGVMSFAIKAAEELGIPVVQFWTASACGFMGYLHYSQLIQRGIVPFKDETFISDATLDTPIDWIPGMPNIRLKDIPSFIRTTDPNDTMLNYLGDEAQNCLKASAIIINTFDAFEHQVLEAIVSKFPSIYTIGPLSLLTSVAPKSQLTSFRPSLWVDDTTCLEWLDQREPNSPILISMDNSTRCCNGGFRSFA
ncbi:unnamed protein product, partial [Vitis vinifera]